MPSNAKKNAMDLPKVDPPPQPSNGNVMVRTASVTLDNTKEEEAVQQQTKQGEREEAGQGFHSEFLFISHQCRVVQICNYFCFPLSTDMKQYRTQFLVVDQIDQKGIVS